MSSVSPPPYRHPTDVMRLVVLLFVEEGVLSVSPSRTRDGGGGESHLPTQ